MTFYEDKRNHKRSIGHLPLSRNMTTRTVWMKIKVPARSRRKVMNQTVASRKVKERIAQTLNSAKARRPPL